MRVGIIGGGQLGRMLGLAGIPLGLEFTFLDPGAAPCAAATGRHLCAAFDDTEALQSLAAASDVITYEFENVPVAALADLPVDLCQPGAQALAAAQERAREKSLFEAAGIPVAPWRAVDDQSGVAAAVADLGLPLIAKTRSLGYDGKGQARIRDTADADGLFARLGGVPLLIERLVPFDEEFSIVGCRARNGETIVYPLTRNTHRDGILVRSEMVADASRELRRQAIRHFQALATALDYVGTLAIEFFVTGELLLGNEFAPRVHNSGHWTIDGAAHCQFENHLRAVCGLPLAPAEPAPAAGMLNLIGRLPERSMLLAAPGAHLHDYGKQPRAGRKVGHVNVVARNHTELTQRLDAVAQVIDADGAAASRG